MAPRIRSWSTNAASNSQTPPFGAPEGGTFVNQLSDILRQIMAEVRAWWEAAGWIDYGHVPTYSSATVLTVPGNQISIYEVGRRIRATTSTQTSVFGTVTAVAYTAVTTVTVSWDSGSLDTTVAEVAVGAATISSPWISFRALAGTILRSQMPGEAIFQTGMVLPYFGTTAPTGFVLWFGTLGSSTSGATNRANADTQALYERIWTTFANTEAAVSGGRGASASADFAANKTIAFPDGRGCVLAMLDNLGGTTAGRITSAISGLDGTKVGARGGDEKMHQHNHAVTDPGHTHEVAVTTVGVSAGGTRLPLAGQPTRDGNVVQSNTTGISVNNSGAGGSQNVQPTIMMPYIVKL